MRELETFMNATGEMSALVRTALTHAQFETIHPFLDGNGRIGRLLVTLQLQQAGLLSGPAFYLSYFINEHRQTYYELLSRIRTHGDWEAWVEYFLDGAKWTAKHVADTISRLLACRNLALAKAAPVVGRAHPSAERVLDAFAERPISSTRVLVERTGLAQNTVLGLLRQLTDLGIVREITGRGRNRLYSFEQYLGILNEGTER